jgi:SNF2 family DNA or RNA helicase
MGVGKTLSTLTALDTLLLAHDGPALVIAPLRVATSTWPQEIAKWAHLAHLRAVPIVGTPAQRTAALRAILTAPRAVRNATIATINYEGLEWIMKALRGHT